VNKLGFQHADPSSDETLRLGHHAFAAAMHEQSPIRISQQPSPDRAAINMRQKLIAVADTRATVTPATLRISRPSRLGD
jgi:hypothetical protein